MKKFKVGFFPGVWDLLHLGHIRALKEAKQYCDYLIIGINIDPSFDNYKKNKPIMSATEREEILMANKYVDYTFGYIGEEMIHFIDKNYTLLGRKVDVRFMGADHKGKKHHPIKAKIVYISRNHNYSTTNLRKKIYEAERQINRS